jgi:hypothetical protein
MEGKTTTISSSAGNPLGTRLAFTAISRGYTSTRLNLAALAGQSVRFRFRLGTDPPSTTLLGGGQRPDLLCASPSHLPPPPTNLRRIGEARRESI